MPLGRLRLHENNAKKGNTREGRPAERDNARVWCEKCRQVGQERVLKDANETSSLDNTSPEDCLSEETPDHANFNHAHDLDRSQSTLEAQEQTSFSFSDYLVDIDDTSLDLVDSEQIDPKGTDLNSQSTPRLSTSSSSIQSFSRNTTGFDAGEKVTQSSDAAFEPERRHKPVFPSLTGIVQELDKGRAGPSHHVAQCCSISRTTIASRLSSVSTQCNFRTLGSEFVQHYAAPGANRRTAATTEPGGRAARSSSTRTESPPLATPFVVESIIQAQIDGLEDEKLEEQLAETFSTTDQDSVRNLVNESDHRGVTALHLCVAYGLWKTCGLLMNCGANHEARTVEDTCVNHFAKPAEKRAGQDDRALYFRIKHCRRHVKKGNVPPVPKPKPKKRRWSVHGPGSPYSFADQRHSGSNREQAHVVTSMPSASTTSGQTSLTTEDGTGYAANEGPQFAEDLTVSPAPTVHGSSSTTDIQDFAKSSSMRRKMFRRNIERQGPSSVANRTYSSNAATTLFGARSTISHNKAHAPHHAHTVQVPSTSADYGNTINRALSYEDVTLRSHDAEAAFDFANQTSRGTTAASFNHPIMTQRSVDYREAPDEEANFPYFPHPGRQHPSQQSTQYYQQPTAPRTDINISRGVYWPPFSQPGNESLVFGSGPAHYERPMEYWHCPHGIPRNYE